jgi:hypothetical protein
MRHRFLMLVLLGGVAAMAGCGKSTTYSTAIRSLSWSGTLGTPGIDEGSLVVIKIWNGTDPPIEFAVWSDLPSQGGTSSSGHGGALVEWRHSSSEGPVVEIHYASTEGQAGMLEIDGRRFEPKAETLFLVRTGDEPFSIEQISFDLAQLPLEEVDDELAAVMALPQNSRFFGAPAAQSVEETGATP